VEVKKNALVAGAQSKNLDIMKLLIKEIHSSKTRA
jgi:hypothetical protein